MFARAAVWVVLLPGFAAADVPPPLAPAWLPESAVIEVPGEAPVTVEFLTELQKPPLQYASYAAALEAARAGDGEAAYTLYQQATRCDLMKRRRQSAAAAPPGTETVPPMQPDPAAFCATMPADSLHLRHHWLRDAADAGHEAAILRLGMSSPREQSRARLEGLWYRGNLPALGELAEGERKWTRLMPESARSVLVRSMGYEWLYVRVSAAAYAEAPDHQRALAQLTRNFEQRWNGLNEDERHVALRLAHSLLLESKACCTVPASGPHLIF